MSSTTALKKPRKLPDWMTGDDTQNSCQTCAEPLTFRGQIRYICKVTDCEEVCAWYDQLATTQWATVSEPIILGFDMEWPVTFIAGTGECKTATIQLCAEEKLAHVFHLTAMGDILPKCLVDLIADHRFRKVGLNLFGDLWKLSRDFDLSVDPIVELSSVELSNYAGTVLKTGERWSLANLVMHLSAGTKELPKENSIRCGDWNSIPLSYQQLLYAANDAYASLWVYKLLQSKT